MFLLSSLLAQALVFVCEQKPNRSGVIYHTPTAWDGSIIGGTCWPWIQGDGKPTNATNGEWEVKEHLLILNILKIFNESLWKKIWIDPCK